MARTSIKCPYPDCFRCPHEDGIRGSISENRPKRTEGKAVSKYSQLPPEEKARRLQLVKQWQKANRERYLATKRAYYHAHRETDLARRRQRRREQKQQEGSQAHGQKHLSDGQTCQRSDPGASS